MCETYILLFLYFFKQIASNEELEITNKSVTLPSCGLRRVNSANQVKAKACLEWHKSILEELVGSDSIKNGNDAEIGQFPYTVLIMAVKPYHYQFCSGAVINQYWIITAAHCITYLSMTADYYVNFSGIDHYVEAKSARYSTKTEKLIPHEKYNKSGGIFEHYDIGLIKTSTKIDLEKAGGVCLPTANFTPNISQSAILTGWGRIDHELKNYERLQMLAINLPPNYDKNRAFIYINAAHGNPCSGDSGSPLVQYVNGRAVLVGILSRTTPPQVKRCGPVKAMYYTTVQYFLRWITDTILNN